MSDDLARAIAVVSAAVTIGALGLAVRFSRRPSRVRLSFDIGMLTVSTVTIPLMAFVTGVHTIPLVGLAAVAAGMVLGGFQGSHAELQLRDSRVYARRSIPALLAWGAGIAIVQGAGAIDRADVVEAGQAVSYFGVGAAFGLLVGRQGLLNPIGRGAIAASGVFMVLACLWPGTGQRASAQTPPAEFALTGRIDARPLVDSLVQANAPGSFGTVGLSEIRLVLPSAGGPVTGEVGIHLEDFPFGTIIALMEGFGEAIGSAITGTESTSTVRPELAACKATFENNLALQGRFAPASGQLNGTLTVTQRFSNLRSCPVIANATEDMTSERGSWQATFDGTTATGMVTVFGRQLPFTASVAKPETPPAPEGAAAGAVGERPENGGPDTELVLPPPIDLPEDIEPTEAAAAGLIGLIPVVLVVGASVAQSVASGATIGTVVPGKEPVAGTPPPSPGDLPAGPQPITPENVEIAAGNIRKMAEEAGYDDIVRAIDRRREAGEFSPAEIEELRELLKKRIKLDEYMRGSELFTNSDMAAFIGGTQEDAARLAELLGQPAIAALLRNPSVPARIAGAMATGGWSEVPMTAWDVYSALDKAANTPGAGLSDLGAAAEIAKVVGWEAAVNVAGDKITGGLLGAGGRAIGLDDAVSAAGRGTDDALRGAARSADEAAELGARNAGVPGSRSDAGSGLIGRESSAAGDLPAGGRADAPGPGRVPDAESPRVSEPEGSTGKAASDQFGGATVRVPEGAVAPPGTPIKDLPDGTPMPIERIAEAGYTRQQAEALRDVAREENALIGSRTTNPDSVAHIESGNAIPKPVDIKAKTTTPIDVELGARDQDRGLVTLFEPNKPPFDISRPDVAADPHAVAVWDRYTQRIDEFNKLKAEVEARPDLEWDRTTGVIYDKATGKPFAGDIDVVYLRDANTGELIGGDRAARIMERLGASDARTQHGAEVQAVKNIADMKGPKGTAGAMKLHESLSRGHEDGTETVIESSAAGWQKGPSPQGMYDTNSPQGKSAGVRRGIGMELPD